MEELFIKVKGENIKIYSFFDKNISLNKIFADYKVDNNKQREDARIVLIDRIKEKDRIFNLRKALKDSDILVINSSVKVKFNINNIKTITYGLDEKSTINFSSIDDINNEQPIVCIQRSFSSVFLKEYDPMEIKVSVGENIENRSTFLGIATLKLLLELD